MTSHLDLSPQSDLSEVKMSAGGQGVGVPVRGERVLNQRSQSPEGNVSSRLLEWRAYSGAMRLRGDPRPRAARGQSQASNLLF